MINDILNLIACMLSILGFGYITNKYIELYKTFGNIPTLFQVFYF